MSKATFLADEHIYLDENGIIIPSVTQLVAFAFPQAYANIPAYILKNKAMYGTKVHEMIEKYIRNEIDLKELNYMRIDPNIKSAVHQYERIRKKNPNMMKIKEMEKIVCFEGRYAGMYDLRTNEDVLIDIKTTATLHKDWLAVQLGLYYMALGIEKDVGYCVWVPKAEPGELVEIEVWNHEKCLDLLERYEKERSTE